jgi:hypothetical protein
MLSWTVNWKTTLAGVAAILGAAGDLAHQASTGAIDPNHAWLDITTLASGVGLVFARDAKSTDSNQKGTS